MCKKLIESLREEIKEKSQNVGIFFVDYSEEYFRYFLEKAPWIGDAVSGVLTETSDRMSGSVVKGAVAVRIGERDVPVYGYEHLVEVPEDSVFIILNDYYKETWEKIKRIEEFAGVERKNVFFFPNRETEIQLDYLEKFKKCELENVIIFRSGPHATQYVPGMDFDDNAKALFEHMLKEGYNNSWRLVWLVKNPEEFAGEYAEYENVEFIPYDWATSEIEKERDAYYKRLFLAKYLFFTDAYGFTRNCREDQVRVQLWHGCGYKTRINFTPCEKRYEYNIVISPVYKKIHERIYGLREDQVIITGYPKEDWLFEPCAEWKELLSVPEAEKYLFWLPTFRKADSILGELDEKGFDGDTGLPIVKSVQDMNKLNEILSTYHMVLVIKLHPFQDRNSIHIPEGSNICLIDNKDLVKNKISINKVLGNADALISDYSSAAVDYLILNRPLAFTLEDVEEYESSRGFVFDNVREWFPGKEIWNFEDFMAFVAIIGRGEDPDKRKRESIRSRMHSFDDAKSSARVLHALGITNGMGLSEDTVKNIDP